MEVKKEVDPIFEISTDPVAMLEARSELRAIDRELDEMQPRKAEMFSRHLNGWDMPQIGGEFGLSRTTIGLYVHVCRKRLLWAREGYNTPSPSREEVLKARLKREKMLRERYEATMKQRRDKALWAPYRPPEREQERNSYRSSGRIVRNGVEVWPPWPK